MHCADEQVGTRSTFYAEIQYQVECSRQELRTRHRTRKEEIFRRAEKEVNRLTAAVESQYMADREDYLAVVALQLAVKVVELEASRSLGRDIDELDALNRRLDEHLNRLR